MGAALSGVLCFQPGRLMQFCSNLFSLSTLFFLLCFHPSHFLSYFFFLLLFFCLAHCQWFFYWGFSFKMKINCFLFCLPCRCHTHPQACWWAWSCATASPPPAITTRHRQAASCRKGPSAPCCLMSVVNSLSTPWKGRSTPERYIMWSKMTCCAR